MRRVRRSLAALDDVAAVQQQGEVVAQLDLPLIKRLEVALLNRVLGVRGGGHLVTEPGRAVLQGDQPDHDTADLRGIGVLGERSVDGTHGLRAVDDAGTGELEVTDLARDGPTDGLDRLAEHGDAVAEVPEVLRLLQERVLDLDVDVREVEGVPDVPGEQSTPVLAVQVCEVGRGHGAV